MLLVVLVWMSVGIALLIAHSMSWAMEKETTPTPYTPARFLHNRLLGTERVMDAPTGVLGSKGNSVQSVQRLNAVLLQQSHTNLRQPGIEKTPISGKVVAPESQSLEQQRRIR